MTDVLTLSKIWNLLNVLPNDRDLDSEIDLNVLALLGQESEKKVSIKAFL